MGDLKIVASLNNIYHVLVLPPIFFFFFDVVVGRSLGFISNNFAIRS